MPGGPLCLDSLQSPARLSSPRELILPPACYLGFAFLHLASKSTLLFFLTSMPFFFFKNCIYFWLCWVFVAAHRLSLDAASRSYSPVAVYRHLIAVASLFGKHGLQGSGFNSCGACTSVAVVHRLSCPTTCGIFLDQGLNLFSLCWQADYSSLDHLGCSPSF